MTRKAFTLIELAISMLIFAIAVVSIYGAFNAGIKAWRRSAESRDFQKIRISLLRMQKELRGSFFFSGVPFKGMPSEITFPVTGEEGKIYAVNYYIAEDKNRGRKVLMKKNSVFADDRFFEEEAVDEFIFSADSIDFEYAYGVRCGLKGLEWKGIWEGPQQKIPLLVKINFKLGLNEDAYHKTILIPQGILGAE